MRFHRRTPRKRLSTRVLSIFILKICVLTLCALAICNCPVHAQINDILLESFTGTGGSTPGSSPEGTLIVDASGNFYGTAMQGGANSAGIVFKLNAASGYSESVLYTFSGGSDGGFPVAGVVLDQATNTLYGTTTCGGDTACGASGQNGDGVAYSINITTSTYAVLYSFQGGRDGSKPYASLIRVGGYVYGTTIHGGQGACSDALGSGCGTIFKIARNTGRETVLYRFGGSTDGGVPYAPLVRDNSGDFDGTTSIGGQNGLGTIYTLIGSRESVLYSFTGGTDGSTPYAGLSVDSLNNLYGTTTCGGIAGTICALSYGVVYKFSPAAGFQTLHIFSNSDGATPVAGVIIDSAGNLCGTTEFGGTPSPGMGTIYTLTKNTGYQLESYSFLGSPNDGANPYAGLAFGQKSKARQLCPVANHALSPLRRGTCTYVCGSTKSGGASGQGAVFQAQ